MHRAPKGWSHRKNTIFLTILTFWHIQCLHLMYAEVAWVLVSSGTQVQPQVILDPDYFPDYLFVSYYYGNSKIVQKSLFIFCLQIASFLDFQNMH